MKRKISEEVGAHFGEIIERKIITYTSLGKLGDRIIYSITDVVSKQF